MDHIKIINHLRSSFISLSCFHCWSRGELFDNESNLIKRKASSSLYLKKEKEKETERKNHYNYGKRFIGLINSSFSSLIIFSLSVDLIRRRPLRFCLIAIMIGYKLTWKTYIQITFKVIWKNKLSMERTIDAELESMQWNLIDSMGKIVAVSYTHLTLPTIYSV